MALEGERMLAEALEAGIAPDVVFHAADAAEEVLRGAQQRGATLVPTTTRELARLSDMPSARGLVALAGIPEPRLPSLDGGAFALLLDGVQDPANVGAILRSAEAFGACGAALTAGCASPYGARALRASAGSALRIPVAQGLTAAEALAWARRSGATLAGAVAHGGEPPEHRTGDPLVLAIGSEGRGLSAEVNDALELRITIPLAAPVESLNAAVAAGILLYSLSPNTSAEKR